MKASDDKWIVFEKSGRVEDYLAYRSALEAADEDNDRCAGDLGSENRGSGQGTDAAL